MSELARRILRKGMGTVRDGCLHCDSCRRTPVPGEFVHRLTSGRVVCSLCLVNVSASKREGSIAARVHATERQISVERRAA